MVLTELASSQWCLDGGSGLVCHLRQVHSVFVAVLQQTGGCMYPALSLS